MGKNLGRRAVAYALAGSVVLVAGLWPSMSLATSSAAASPALRGSLRIYRTVSARGTPVLVLTNLDEEGNLLTGDDSADEGGPPAPGSPTAVSTPSGSPPPTEQPAPVRVLPGPGEVTVLVHQGENTAPIDERSVEVRSDGAGATTVVVNINLPLAPSGETTYLPAPSYPLVAYGGLPGRFRYPDHLPFLGYGTSNDTPVFFGGLGLSSTERYARAAGRPMASRPGCPGRSPGAAH